MPFSAEEAKRILSIQGNIADPVVAAMILGISEHTQSLGAEAFQNAHRIKSLLVHPDDAPTGLKKDAKEASSRLTAAKKTLLDMAQSFQENTSSNAQLQAEYDRFRANLIATQQLSLADQLKQHYAARDRQSELKHAIFQETIRTDPAAKKVLQNEHNQFFKPVIAEQKAAVLK